jgi:hypothetical protein
MEMRLQLLGVSAQDSKPSPVLGYVKTIMRLLPVLLPVSLALCLCGCGPGYTFSPWTGPQQNWTTGPGGYVRMIDNVPVFAPGQYPSKPYVVLGAVTTDDEDNLADAAHEQHADAILLSTEYVRRTGSVAWAAPGVAGVSPITKTTITANLIKYK